MKFLGTRLRALLFAGLLTGCALLFFLRQPKYQESRIVYLLDRVFVGATSPFTHAFLATRNFVVHTAQRYFFLVGVERENDALKKTLQEVQQENLFLKGLQDENERLRTLASFQQKLTGQWIGAHVISYPPLGAYRIMTIDRGSEDGVAMRSPVVSVDGLVGQVTRLFPKKCQVLLMTDPTSAVDVRIQSSGARGLVVGKTSKLLDLKRDLYIGAFEYLSQAVSIEEGASVVTSGLDGVYPPDIPVGLVHGAKKKKYDIFLEAEVFPAVDFYRVREVLVRIQP